MPDNQKQTPEMQPLPPAAEGETIQVFADADSFQANTGTPHELPGITQESQEESVIGKIGVFALSAATAYAAIKGNVSSPDLETASGSALGALSLKGLHRGVAEYRLNRLEKKIPKKESEILEDDRVKPAIAETIFRGRAHKPENKPVTSEQIDVSRRTDKRTSRITKAHLEIDRNQQIWGKIVDGVPNIPDVSESEKDNIPRHDIQLGEGAKHDAAEPPNGFNNWGKGRRGYTLKETIPDVGTKAHADRLRTERFTPEEIRVQKKAGRKVRRLERKVERNQAKIYEDIHGEDRASKRNRRKLAEMYEKRDELEDKVEELS